MTAWEGYSDGALLAPAQDNQAAFAALYRRHLGSVYRYLLSRSGNVQDAQDLTSHLPCRLGRPG